MQREKCAALGVVKGLPPEWLPGHCNVFMRLHPEERSRGQNLILRPRRSPQEH